MIEKKKSQVCFVVKVIMEKHSMEEATTHLRRHPKTTQNYLKAPQQIYYKENKRTLVATKQKRKKR